ncbi:MAG TPA: alpha/beta fold hydrolase [Steroidobacteraceae bacterium]|nr:alpha/beta fold hydrolase [Steroidobacteraceae bacterium]
MSTVVVYVHGLWLSGNEAGILLRRLGRQLNVKTRAFSYASMTSSISDSARALATFLRVQRADTLHLVGHSLGGLVILKLFENGEDAQLPPGRIVLLGSPLNGSRAAQNLARLPFGRKIMGRGVREDLLTERQRRWTGQRELGVIAGSVGIGLGRLVGVFGAPSDGTIFVEETRLPGILDHLVLRVSHTALPFSSTVARQTAAFLSDGNFMR